MGIYDIKKPEGFLASCIPDLQFDLFAINGNHACTKLHANGQIMHRLEALVRELQQQT